MQLSLAEIYMDEAEQLNKDSLSVLIQTSIDSLVIPELRSMLPDVRNRH